MSNKFYAVSTGPSSSSFLTLQAIEVLKKCGTIFYPVTSSSEKSHVAFDCISSVIDVSEKKCIPVSFSMSKSEEKTRSEYEEIYKKIETELSACDVAFVSIGDVSVYSTAARIARKVESEGFYVEFVSGVTSFCLAACECKLDLAEKDEEIRIIPGDAFFKSGKIDDVLKSGGTKIIMKSPRNLRNIIERIVEFDLVESAHLVKNAGYSNEKIVEGRDILKLTEEDFLDAYMSVLIVSSAD